MKVLVSTRRTQGDVPGDYCCTDDGELVRTWDCPCVDRCALFSGLETHKGTTTAEVVERPDLDESTLVHLFRQDLVNGGWDAAIPDEVMTAAAREEVDMLVEWVGRLEVGTVVERSGPGFMRVRCWSDGTRVSHPGDWMTA